MPGAILRVPVSGTTQPGGIVGSLDVSGTTVSPYDVQRTITSVSTTTALVVDVLISTRAGVGFTISDPVDMEPGMMMNCFLKLCEAEFARINNRKDWLVRDKAFRDALIIAMGADNRQRDIGRGGGSGQQTLADWAIREAYHDGSVVS